MTRRSFGILGLAFLAVYLGRNGVEVWPFLSGSAGDFVHFHEAGRLLLHGESPYSAWLTYPPLMPFLMVPFGALDFQTARIAWFGVGHLCLVGSALLLWKPLGGDSAALLAIGATWSLGGAAQETLGLGQVTPLLLLLIAWAIRVDAKHPDRSAAALGLAAAIKIWPGLLLAADLLPGRRKSLCVGIGTAALGVAIPLALLMALVPRPWAPLNAGFWMGTPAPLNVSVPATSLRLTYDRPDDRVPEDWETGTHPRIHLPAWRQAVTAGAACATLALGLLAAGLAVRPLRPLPAEARVPLLLAMVALALLASPISWYHYQVMQFPALAWLTAKALRQRAWLPVTGMALLEIGLTRPEVRDLLLGGGGAGRAASQVALKAMLPGLVVAALGAVLFGLLLAEVRRIARSGPPTGPVPSS